MGAMKKDGVKDTGKDKGKSEHANSYGPEQLEKIFLNALKGEKLTDLEKSELETSLKGKLKANKKAAVQISIENGKIFAAIYRANGNSRKALQAFLTEAAEDGCLFRSGIQPALSDMARFEVWEGFKDDLVLSDVLIMCPAKTWDQFAKQLSKKHGEGFADIEDSLRGLSHKLSDLRKNPNRSNEQIKERFHAAIKRFNPSFDPSPQLPGDDSIFGKLTGLLDKFSMTALDLKEDTSITKAQAIDLQAAILSAREDMQLLESFIEARYGTYSANPSDGAIRFTGQISEKAKAFKLPTRETKAA
jgi:hypothetical protein